MAKVFPFSSLPTADLVIDAVYEGGTKGNAGLLRPSFRPPAAICAIRSH
jgi:hypothetical protein